MLDLEPIKRRFSDATQCTPKPNDVFRSALDVTALVAEVSRLTAMHDAKAEALAVAESQVARLRAAMRDANDWRDESGASFMDLREAIRAAGADPYRTANGGADRVRVAIDCVAQIADENRRLRAALDAERAACDEWRENQHMHYKGIFGEAPCHDGACPLCVKHDARRAA